MRKETTTMRYTKTLNGNLYNAWRETQEAERGLESLYAVTNTKTVTSMSEDQELPWHGNQPEKGSDSDLDEVSIEEIEYVMETPSKENEVVESAGDNLFLEVKGDQYLSS